MRDKHVKGQRDASDTYLRVHVAGAIRIPIELLILQFFTSPPHFMSLYDFIKVHSPRLLVRPPQAYALNLGGIKIGTDLRS